MAVACLPPPTQAMVIASAGDASSVKLRVVISCEVLVPTTGEPPRHGIVYEKERTVAETIAAACARRDGRAFRYASTQQLASVAARSRPRRGLF